MSKKTLFVAILTGVLMVAPLTHADVASDLQMQISSLLATIKSLQTQIEAIQKTTSTVVTTPVISTPSTTSSTQFCYTFNRNLTVGSTGADVRALNNVLSLENISDRVISEIDSFDEFTAGHVVKLQTKYGINATGYFGPMTRARINALYVCDRPLPSKISPMIISDIRSVTSVSPQSTANLGFGVKEISAQYNLGAYHSGTWYEGMNPNVSGPMWIEFGWPNSPAVDAVFLDQNNIERKVYLPAFGSNIDQNNVPQNWYFWIAEDGSSYYANTSHSYGWPNLTYKEALAEKHLARKAGTVPSFNIVILTPKSGDVVNVGTPVRIDWGAFGNADNSALYDITLFTDNGKGNIADGVTQAQAGCLGYGKGVCSYIWTPTSASSKTQIAVSKRGTTEIGYSGFFKINSTNQPSLTVSSPAQPSSTIAPKNAARIPFTKFTVRATGGDVVLNSFVVQNEGSAPNSVLSSIIILDEYGQPVGLPHSLDSNHQIIIGGKLTIKSGTSRTLTIAGSTASDLSASAGKTISLSLVGVNTSSVVSGQLPIAGASHVVNNTLNIGTLTYTRVNKSVTNSNTTYDLSFTAGSAEAVRLKSFVLQNISWYGSVTVNETGATYYCSRTLLDTAYCDFGAGILIGKGLTVSLSSNRVGGFVVIPQVADINAVGEVYGYGIVPVYGSVSVNSSPKIVGFPVVPASVQPGQMVNFNFTAKDSDNDDLSWSFEFGDGSGVADACSVNRPKNGKGADMTIGHVWGNAGIYQFNAKVYDCQGGSDSYKFFVNVGSVTNNLPPVINGVEAPTTLNVGQTGTWTIKASDPENGNLSYSVIWGDEQNYIAMNAGSVSSAPFVQSATFTHSYATAGTYNVSVSVRDNAGQITKTSATVRVTNSSTQPSITILSPNGGEVWNATNDNVISWKYDSSMRGPAYAYLQFQDGSKCFLGGGKDVTYNTMSINLSKVACVNTLKQIPSGQYKILVSVGDGWEAVSVDRKDSSDNFFTVNGISDDSSTASATVSVVTESTKDDKAGAWHVFSPNGYPDMNWTMTLNITGGQKTIKSISIFNSSNGWGTNLDNLDIGKGHYPLVVFQNGSQLVDSYNRVIGTYTTGTYTFKLYGEGFGGYSNLKAVVRFVDGTSVTASPSSGVSSITVLSPNGGEIWPVGSNQTIKWKSSSIPSDQVLIQYYKNTNTVLDFYVPNTGSAQITVPVNIGTGNDFSITIGYKDTAGVFYSDSSDAYFTISSATSQPLTNEQIFQNLVDAVKKCSGFSSTNCLDFDLNGDGNVTSADINMIKSLVSLTEEQYKAVSAKIMDAVTKRFGTKVGDMAFEPLLDIDGNGTMTIGDALKIRNAMGSIRPAITLTSFSDVPTNVLTGELNQSLGGFIINNTTGEAVSISKISFVVDALNMPNPIPEITNVSLFNSSGAVVAGPFDFSNRLVTFTDTFVVPAGNSTYVIKGKLSTMFANNQTFNLAMESVSWPVGQTTGKVYSLPAITLRLNKLTIVTPMTDAEILTNLEQAARNRTKSIFVPATDTDFDMNNDRQVNATDQIIIRMLNTITDDNFDIAYKRIVKIVDSQVGKTKTDSSYIDELDVDRNGVISAQDKANILRVIIGTRVYTASI